MTTRAVVELHATETRIKQLAKEVSAAVLDASPENFRQRVYEATCDALKAMRENALESAATKLDAYIEGRKFLGADDTISAASAARMIRDLKEILSRG